MGRPKGSNGNKNRYWSTDEKLRIIQRVINGEGSSVYISKDENISNGMLCNWMKVYYEKGVDGLINKKKPGNPLAKFQNRKSLTSFEQLQYENMKLKIENERLKKGYLVKGDGQVELLTSSNKKNLK